MRRVVLSIEVIWNHYKVGVPAVWMNVEWEQYHHLVVLATTTCCCSSSSAKNMLQLDNQG